MNVYEIITERITKQLEAGSIPWQKPWKGGGAPLNLSSKKEYRGINVFMLSSLGYESPYFVTYNQAQEMGGTVKKGEKGSPVVFWKWLQFTNEGEQGEEGESKKAPMLRYYTVFNVSQCEGLKVPSKSEERVHTPIEACEVIAKGYHNSPVVKFDEARAYYRPSTDVINMPRPELFKGSEEYYSTLFHEMTHSTGHENRLNRKTITDICPFGSTNYSKEELIAEMGAAFLCGHAGIENKTIDNSAAYIKSWLKALRNDSKLIVMAAAQAQKSTDFILGRQHNAE